MSRYLNWSVIVLLLLFVATASVAQEAEMPQDPASPNQLQQPDPVIPKVFRLNRDVPCTDIAVVRTILAQRGQVPIVSGQSFQPIEQFGTVVIALNEETGEFSVIVVSNDQTVACNIYAGGNFRLLSQ